MTTCRMDCLACDAKNIRCGTCGYCRKDLCEECCRPDFNDECGSECSNDAFDWCCLRCWLLDTDNNTDADEMSFREMVEMYRAKKPQPEMKADEKVQKWLEEASSGNDDDLELPCPDCRRWFDDGKERCKSCDYKFDEQNQPEPEPTPKPQKKKVKLVIVKRLSDPIVQKAEAPKPKAKKAPKAKKVKIAKKAKEALDRVMKQKRQKQAELWCCLGRTMMTSLYEVQAKVGEEKANETKKFYVDYNFVRMKGWKNYNYECVISVQPIMSYTLDDGHKWRPELVCGECRIL